MSAHNGEVSKESLERGHEQSDLGIGMLFGSLLVLMIFTAVFAVLMALMWQGLDGRQAERLRPSSPLVETDVTPPEPRLESRSGEIWEQVRALRALQAETYTWLDRDNGIARIPVERAMEIVAERGLAEMPATDVEDGQ